MRKTWCKYCGMKIRKMPNVGWFSKGQQRTCAKSPLMLKEHVPANLGYNPLPKYVRKVSAGTS